MLRRLFLICLPSLSTSVSFANPPVWSCQQNNKTNDWVCGDGASIQSVTLATQALATLSTDATSLVPTINPNPKVLPPVADTSTNNTATATPAEPKAEVRSPPAFPDTDPEIDVTNTGWQLFTPSFSTSQEHIFTLLNEQFAHDPWGSCLLPKGTQRSWTPYNKELRNKASLEVKSNYSEIFDNEIGVYSGQVEMHRADQHAKANHANYDTIAQTLSLQGNVYYSEDELALHSESAQLKLASDQAKIRETLFIYPAAPLRGRAKAIFRDNKYLSHYREVSYTSCKPGNQDWVLHAGELKLNKQTGKGSAKNTWLEFKGVPVFYSPYMAFPIDNRRLSGFLSPSFGNTSNGGFTTSTPYYWNLAPNYDAVLNPRYFTKRGILLTGDLRYLSQQSHGLASIEYMPDDDLKHTDRYLASLTHTTQFSQHIQANLDVNQVSDKGYFTELGNALSYPNFSFLKSQADVNYLNEGVDFTARVESYQTIDPTLSSAQIPYRRLPQINLTVSRSLTNQIMPIDATLQTESVYFQHDDLVNGQRFTIKPSLSLPLQTSSAYLTPKASVHYTQYLLNSPSSGLATDVSRVLPSISVDTGTFFERDLNLSNKRFLHTIEPRLFYLYIPKTDQSQIPIFDTSIYDFWYSSMFRENRFSGSDRIQDANQVTAALSSSLIDPVTGLERLKLSVGEIFYFRNRDVTLCGDYLSSLCALSPKETATSSPLVTELSSQLTDKISIDTGVQWDPHSNAIVRGKLGMHYVDQTGKIINMGYLYRQEPLIPEQTNDITQSDFSVRWPIYDNWYAVGRWQYSWLYNKTQDGFLGLEKENCCWRFRVIGRRYLSSINQFTDDPTLFSNSAEGNLLTGIFFQIELKGLTGIGEKLDAFFEKSIYGYRKPTT
jgi:LPS-assembly protein